MPVDGGVIELVAVGKKALVAATGTGPIRVFTAEVVALVVEVADGKGLRRGTAKRVGLGLQLAQDAGAPSAASVKSIRSRRLSTGGSNSLVNSESSSSKAASMPRSSAYMRESATSRCNGSASLTTRILRRSSTYGSTRFLRRFSLPSASTTGISLESPEASPASRSFIQRPSAGSSQKPSGSSGLARTRPVLVIRTVAESPYDSVASFRSEYDTMASRRPGRSPWSLKR